MSEQEQVQNKAVPRISEPYGQCCFLNGSVLQCAELEQQQLW